MAEVDRVPPTTAKKSYVVPCPIAFRDAVTDLAVRRRVNVGDLARSVLLLLPPETVAAAPDPGDPPPGERETVVLKTGPNAGRPWRRKPRLQVRLPPGFRTVQIRRALGLALALDRRERRLCLEDARQPSAAERLARAESEALRLTDAVRTLVFQPLPDRVRSRTDALYVLGFPADARPDAAALRARFRALAAIHHPDSPYGDPRRMSQLNQAIQRLRAEMRTGHA